jgi:hypothetical protein
VTRTRTWDIDEAFDRITAGETTLRQYAIGAKVSAAAVSKGLITKFGPDWQGTPVRHYGRLPWVLPKAWHGTQEAQRLRLLLRREAGEPISKGDEGRLDGWLATIPEGFVVAFDPLARRGDGSWVYRRRLPWEQDGRDIFHGVMAKEAWPEEPC